MKPIPPSLAGRKAYRDGEPIEANPHPPGILQGDAYPGPHVEWRWGWLNERAITTERRTSHE